MRTENLLKDPVFQLNLLLWMAKEQPRDSFRIRPVFYECGFSIVYIEQPFRFPEETMTAISGSGLEISTTPEPELYLKRDRDQKALYIEAKANSFGSSSTTCKQARAHLIAAGPAFAEVFRPLKECLLCYVLPASCCDKMDECLRELAEDLRAKQLQTGLHSCHGIELRGSELVYGWDSAFKTHVEIADDDAVLCDGLEEETNPSPLVLVFSDQDCADPERADFYREIVIDQVRSEFLCIAHSQSVGLRLDLSADKLLEKITDGIFKYLGKSRRDAMSRLIRENFLRRIRDYWDAKGLEVTLTGNTLSLVWQGLEQKVDFLDWLENRRTKFDASKLQPVAPSLFSQEGNP